MRAHRISSQRLAATETKPAATARSAADKMMADNVNQFSQWAGDKTNAEATPPINSGRSNLDHPAGAAGPGSGHFTVSADNPFFQGTEAIPQPAAQATGSPVHQSPPWPATGNPFLDPRRPDAGPQPAECNPFLTPGKPYAQPTPDGQAVPQIFGQTDAPAAPNSNNPFVNGSGAAAGLSPALAAADTAKANVEQQTRLAVFCMGMHDFVLTLCEQDGLPPSAVKGLLDLFLDASVTAIQASQTIMASAGLGGSAPPVDPQAIKAAALARQADSTKRAELTRLQQMKKRQPRPDDLSTFDPLTRRNAGRHQPITRLSSLVKPGRSTGSASSSDADSSGATPPQRSISSNASQAKIPQYSSSSISDSDSDSDSDDGSDEAGESSSADDSGAVGGGIGLSQTLSHQTPPVARQRPVVPSPPVAGAPVKPQNHTTSHRLPVQQRNRQDDQATANLDKKVPLKAALSAEHALAIADLEQKLAQITAQQGRKDLLSHSKDLYNKLHRQATEEWSRLHKKEKAGTATPDELARMEEMDIRSAAAVDQVSAIKSVAAKYGIAL